jgi:hypothetical protein
MTPFRTGKDRKTGKTYSYYTCMKRRKEGSTACPDGATFRGDELEREVMAWVDDLLDDPDRIAKHIDEAIARETAALRDPDAEARIWAERIFDCDRKRAAYQDQQAAGYMPLDELGAKLKQLDEDRATAEQHLDRLKGGQQRIQQLKAQKRFILETFGEGLKLGLMWFPPQVRRAIYQMLQLKITVSGDGTIWAEADVNANVICLTRDVEEYARRLNEAKRRIEVQQEAGELSTWEAVDRIETELRRIRDSLSTTETDKVMSVVASE